MLDLNLIILITRGWKLQSNKRQNVAHESCLLFVTNTMSTTRAVLGLTATSSNYPIILGSRVGTGPFREQGRSVQGSLNLQKGLCGLFLAITMPGSSFLFSCPLQRQYKLTGTCFSFHPVCLFLGFPQKHRGQKQSFLNKGLLEKTLILGKTEGGRRRGWQRMRCWMASPTQWTWV